MKVLVIGQGGREHTIIKTLKKSSKVDQIYCAPGNGGMVKDAICFPIDENDFAGLTKLVKEKQIDLTIVGPENPLLIGIADYFEENNLAIIGPKKKAAEIEGSKSFAKEIMKKYNIPTGDYQVFTSKHQAIEYLEEKGVPIVIKADGLAAGKGVTVAFTKEEALLAINQMMEDKVFGDSGSKIVMEEYLEGEELTVMAFVDGQTIIPMEAAQDHKPIYDHDQGPNTGGMGSYSPVPHMRKELLDEIYRKVLVPVVEGLKEENISYSGILYAGLMITKEGPKVIEFNARFGDPETQVVLPRLKNDLVDVFMAIHERRLKEIQLEWDEQAAVCVIMASEGYPKEYKKGYEIKIGDLPNNVEVIIAGASYTDGKLLTSGGRVLGVTALDSSIERARNSAYQGVNQITFNQAHYRKDIAKKALNK